MNALLDHVGVSAAVDWVWAQVTGLRLAKAVRRPLMTLQAFVDESESRQIFVLAGCIAPAESWAAFTKDWEEILPLAPLGPDMKRNFKFSEMLNAGLFRTEQIPIFGSVIERHIVCSFSFHMLLQDLQRAAQRVRVPGVPFSWEDLANPYMFGFVSLMGLFHKEKPRIDAIIGSDQPVDFFFDKRGERRKIYKGWDEYVENQPGEIRSRFGTSSLRFEDDKEFLPLQAADFMAGWLRYWLERGEKPRSGKSMFAGRTLSGRELPHFAMSMSENDIVEFLIDSIRKNYSKPCYICDIRVSFGV
jgi:Protein of unknown function (DUF3800)